MLVPLLLVILALLLIQAGRGHLLSFSRRLLRGRLQPGVPIVYRVAASSTQPPDPEARDVHPVKRGDLYHYLIKKYWRVEQVLQDGRIVAVTPLMEHHFLRGDDPNLRRANLLERLRHGARFPRLA